MIGNNRILTMFFTIYDDPVINQCLLDCSCQICFDWSMFKLV